MGDKNKYRQMKRFSIVGFTIVIVVLPFCLYYLFFVTSQTAYFSKRNFRVLADIGDHIVSKIDNLGENLVNLAKKTKQKVENKQPETKQTVKPVGEVKKLEEGAKLVTDLQIDPRQYQQVQLAAQSRAPVFKTAASARPLNKNSGTPAPTANKNSSATDTSANGSRRIARSAGKKTSAAPDSAQLVTMSVIPDQGSFWLNLEYQGPENTVPGRSDLKSLIEPFVSRYVIDELNETKERLFDDVLVAEQTTGRVIFERGPTGLNVVTLDSLLTDKGAKFESKLTDQSSGVVNVQLAGTDYKLFLQPVRLTLSDREDKDRQGVRWLVCGLTRTDHFRDETFAVSYTVLIFFVFGVLLAVLSWPLLKLKLMGPKDRLRRADLALTAASALLGTATITFVLLDAHTYLSLEDTLDQHLEAFSSDIKSNVHEELGRAVDQLAQLNERMSHLPKAEQTDATKALEGSKNASAEKAESPNGAPPPLSARRDILRGDLDWRQSPYPYFNNATWTDPKGEQRIKWTTQPATTAFVNVSARQFFKDAQDSRTWKLNYGGKNYEYTFELIDSKNTGKNIAIIATRVPGSTWVSNLDTRMLSLMGVVLPGGFGYAVIDADGQVLFHSDEVKNLKEQFFAECENDRRLRAAVLTRTDRFVNANYLGKGHTLFVSPLPGTPWVLVTFRDKQIARTINLELLTMSMVLYIGFTAIMFALISAIFLPKQAERIRWFWPDPKRARRYELMILANLVIGGIFVASLIRKSGWLLVACCVIIPLVATVIGTLLLRRNENDQLIDEALDGSGRGRFLSYRVGYSIAFVGFVTLVSVLPPVGFFEVARSFELRLMVKHGQVTLAKELEQRDQRIASQYAAINIGDRAVQSADQANARSSGRKAKPADDWKDAKPEFLARRLEPGGNSLDVYDSFFFETGRAGTGGNFVDESLGGVDRLLARVRPLYNQSCVESQELSNVSSSDKLWRWKVSDDGHVRLEKDRDGRPDELSVALTSSLPTIVAPNTTLKLLGLIATVSVLLLLIHSLVRFVARRFFLLEMDLPNSSVSPKSYVLLRDSITGNGKKWSTAEYCVTDLTAVKNWEAWRAELTAKINGSNLPVVLDRFECGMDDPRANAEKLKAIESLLLAGKRVVVVSTVEPMGFSFAPRTGQPLASGNGKPEGAPAELGAIIENDADVALDDAKLSVPYALEVDARARWTTVFTALPTLFARDDSDTKFVNDNRHFVSILKTRRPWRYIEAIGTGIAGNGAAQAIKRDRSRDEEQINQVGEQARALHESLWQTCTEGQRCTLIHLAQDGMISPKNKHLRRLVKRGLVVREPELRLMDESFRRFVISISREQDIEAWRQQEGGSAWQLLRAPLLLIVIGVALFLFITQKDVYDSTISFMSAVTAGIAALFKLLGMFQKGKSGAGDLQ